MNIKCIITRRFSFWNWPILLIQDIIRVSLGISACLLAYCARCRKEEKLLRTSSVGVSVCKAKPRPPKKKTSKGGEKEEDLFVLIALNLRNEDYRSVSLFAHLGVMVDVCLSLEELPPVFAGKQIQPQCPRPRKRS